MLQNTCITYWLIQLSKLILQKSLFCVTSKICLWPKDQMQWNQFWKKNCEHFYYYVCSWEDTAPLVFTLYLLFRNTLRITKASQLESVDSKSKKNAFLGKDSKEFDFGQLNLNIDFAEVNVTSKYGTKGNIDNLNIWLEKVC